MYRCMYVVCVRYIRVDKVVGLADRMDQGESVCSVCSMQNKVTF